MGLHAPTWFIADASVSFRALGKLIKAIHISGIMSVVNRCWRSMEGSLRRCGGELRER